MNYFGEKLMQYGSYFLVFFAPLVFLHNRLFPHISTKTFFIYGVIEVIFFAWIYAIIFDKSYRLSKKNLIYFLPLTLFVAWMTLAGIFAVNPSLSFWSPLGRGTGLLTLYHSLALAIVAASLVKKYGLPYLISIFQWFMYGAVILALSVWGGIDGFHLPFRVLETDAGGGFAGNSTLAAGYLLFALAMAAFLLSVKSISTFKKWFIAIGAAIIIFSPVFVTVYGLFAGRGMIGTARGTIIALALGVVSAGLGYMFLSQRKSLRRLSIGMVAIGMLTFSYLWIQLITPNTYLNTVFTDVARGSRFIFWDIAEKAILKRPIFGYGPENYMIAFQENFNPQILIAENSFEGWTDRAHNVFYELGATAGLPSIVLYLVFLGSIFYVLYGLHQQGQLSRTQTSILAGLLVAYIVNNLFTFDSNLSLMSLFLLSGIVYGLANQNDPKQKFIPVKIDPITKNIIAFGLLVLFLVSWIFLAHRPSLKSKAYTEVFATPIDKRADLYPKLLKGSHIGEDWDVSDLAFNTHKLYSSNPTNLKADKVRLPHLIKNLEGLLAYLYEISKRNKTDYRLYLTIAHLENTLTYLSGRPFDPAIQDRILDILQNAKKLSLTNPNVYWSLAQTKVWGNDLAGVEEAYKQATLVAPRNSSPYNLLLNFAKITGNQKLFDETLIQAKQNMPGYEFK